MERKVMEADSPQILIVDDLTTNLKLLTDILVENGYNVRPANTGELALRSINFELPDLILLDIKMPNMDGYEVCKCLKLDEKTCRIPVIFISALDEVANKIEGFAVGGVDYITKPFEAEEVLMRVKNQLSLCQMQKQLELQNAQLREEISKRMHIEHILRNSEERYRTVFENTGTAMLVIEEDMVISMINTKAANLFGYSKEEIEGKMKWNKFVAEDNLERMKQYHHHRMGQANVSTVYENKLINKQGAVINISEVVTMIPETKKSVASLLDITERKEMERKLQEANEKLSDWVKELEEWNREMAQLSEMGELLQSSQSLEEVYSIGSQFIQRIFPEIRGALYLVNPSHNMAEAVIMWGGSLFSEQTFMTAHCWALRHGRLHLVTNPKVGPVCHHITKPQVARYLCLPLMAEGEVLGVLHLQWNLKVSETAPSFNEHKQQLAEQVADYIALALSNLRLREILRQQSIRDMLTGLFNRRYLEETLARELQRAEREKKPVGVIMFDIDYFKEFNDTFGHDGGDALLRELGVFLKKSTRGGDVVSRYGGDEFFYMLPDATSKDALQRAEELRLGVKELWTYNEGKPLIKCTLSFGVAAFPQHGLTGEEIIKSADIALYCAKNQGRDRVSVASDIS